MTFRRTRYSAAMVLSAAAAAFSIGANAQNYLIDLGPVAPALGINNSGQVVLQNYLYSNGVLTPFPSNFTGAAINASGQVAGSVSQTLGGRVVFPYAGIYSNGTVTNLPPAYDQTDDLTPGMTATGINDNGQVIGYVNANGNPPLGWLYTNGTIQGVGGPFNDTPCPGIVGIPEGINNSADIVGALSVFEGGTCAFVEINGTYTDLGYGWGYAINSSGQATGAYWTLNSLGEMNDSDGFLFANGKLTIIPELVQGSALNSTGFIVGYASFFDGVALDLNTFVLPSDPIKPYVSVLDARGINDSGLIVLNAYDSRASGAQAYHAYLLQVPLIRVTPGPLIFSSQKSGTVSAPQTVTFTNEGATSLALGSVGVSSGFSLRSNACASSLAPGAACAITVAYAPVVAGSANGNLTLGAGGVPIAVPLAGSSPLSVSISVSSTTATVGEPVMLTWTASGGAACTATGGSAADGWTGTVPDSGSRAVTESTGDVYLRHQLYGRLAD